MGIIVLPPGAQSADCTTTVNSLAAASDAVDAAAPGATVCVADGTYGKLSLSATKAAPGVTIRAEHPGQATIAGATLDGSYLTVAQFRMTGTFEPRPGSTGMTADHNLFVGGNHYAVMAAATTTTTVNDVAITNNRFDGRFDEDAIRLNRYHDGPDADSIGILIEGNEFLGNVEYGGHNDVLQTVWVGDHLVFRRNYLHHFGGQGFFVKDQQSAIDGITVEDNLIVDQSLRCDPTSLCPTWQLIPFQIFGPATNVTIRHNTVWPGSGGGQAWLRGSGWGGAVTVSDNVFDDLQSDASGLTLNASNNSRCKGDSLSATGFATDCNPAFRDAANGDYRLASGRGVTWSVADQHFGPTDAGGGTPGDPGDPGEPTDTTPPTTTISSGPQDSTTATTASFAFAANEDATYECQLDLGAFETCTSPKRYDGVTAGQHAFSVRAKDTAGNVGAPATRAWTVTTGGGDPGEPTDDAAPRVWLSAPASGARVYRRVSLTAGARDDKGIARVELWLDDERLASDDAAPFTASVDAWRLRDETRTISVRAFDTSGHAVSQATRVRLVRSGRSYVVRRGSTLSSAPTAAGTTQLTGTATGGGAQVSLTPCNDADGTVADAFPLAADQEGKLALTYAEGGVCVLTLERLDS